jgi:glycosyltransferase involved in cell wall biosynthesis
VKLALVVLTNGRRDCIERTIPSLEEYVSPLPAQDPHARIIVDDSGDRAYGAWLEERFAGFDVYPVDRSRGYAAAMRRAIALGTAGDADWLFFTEDDFVYQRPVDLRAIAAAMDAEPRLAQVVLRRQAWFPSERKAGGMIERFDPALFTQRDGYIEHRVFWSGNPHLVRTSFLRRHPWPLGDDSERRFGRTAFGDPRVSVALWGRRDDVPWVEHIGAVRVGSGY